MRSSPGVVAMAMSTTASDEASALGPTDARTLFQAGVAGAPATDPHFFGSDDVAIARRPQTHPETFKRGALQYAGNLRDHLLIIHGMEDDVVPFATSVALAEEFLRLGKDFDFAFAPAATHGWTQRPACAAYLMRRLVQHFDRYLGAGPR